MARWETLLYAVGLLLSGAGKTDAFYLPGKAPNSYSEGEKVRVLSSLKATRMHARQETVLLAILIMGYSWVGMHGRVFVLRVNALKTD